MTTESSSSRSSSTADSYIGSLISLTSKSEIRYEGILYNINTEESSIGLRSVRSFGTEGRKKDGAQVPPSDKVYEYILFRGSDIKDLQVKQSPPVQPTAPINNDPAIIQSHYSRPASTSASVPSAATGSLTDINSHSPQIALPGSNFQAGVPLYQPPGGSIGSWGASPPPTANGSGLAMPMYWPGYYPSPNGLPHIPQQSLLRPPPGLSVPPTMQQQMQYPNFNTSLSSGASNVSDVPSPLLSASSAGLNVSSIPLTSSNLQSTISPVPSATLASDTLPISVPNKAPISALPAVSLNASLPTLPPLMTSTPEISTTMPPMASKPIAIAGSSLHHQNAPLSAPSNLEISKSAHSETLKQTPAPTLSLVTPGQLLQSGPTVPSPQPTQAAHKDVEVVQVALSSPEPSASVEPEIKPPILPLPPPARAVYKNGIPYQYRHGHRGGYERGRGTGSSHQVTKFTEEFDFTAMNEKFKKDEVWGHLGKSSKSHAKDRDGDVNVSDEDDYHDEDPADFPKFEIKPSYNKDDFFDSLSSNALDNESHSGRTRYSEQMKIDTETFGDFSRYRGGRGGRGPGRGGRFRGGYYGRGYGHAGRGWGRSAYNYNRAS